MKHHHVTNISTRGRWITSADSLITSWASSSFSFIFSGTHLSIRCGPQSSRKRDEFLLAIFFEDLLLPEDYIKAGPGDEIFIFESKEVHSNVFIKVVMMDWAATFELSGLMTDDDGQIEFNLPPTNPSKRILVIGDSNSCAYASFMPNYELRFDEKPLGIFAGFPFFAQRHIASLSLHPIDIDLVAYREINLVRSSEDEKSLGMTEAFFWNSIRKRKPYVPQIDADAILIALGTEDQFDGISKELFASSLAGFIKKLLSSTIPNHSIQHVWIVPPFPDLHTSNTHLTDSMENFILPFVKQELSLYTTDRPENENVPNDSNRLEIKLCNLVQNFDPERDTTDGVHPSLEAQESLGRALGEFIKKELLLGDI